MSLAAVRAAIAAKEELLGFNDRYFERWYQGQKRIGSEIVTRVDTEAGERAMRSLIEQSVPPAELFVIEPVMSAVVKMAAEDLPADATFLTDDLPTQAGMLFFADPLPLPNRPDDHAALDLDTILWLAQPGGVLLVSWAQAVNPHGRTYRLPMSFGSIGFDNHPVADFYQGASQNHQVLNVALSHALSALRIMQQPYAAQATEHAPRAAAKRLARQNASSNITVITFRQPQRPARERDAERAWTLDHRVLVRGYWRRHQHYKTPDGRWAEKQIYIGPYVKGPEGAPLVVTKKVNDLIR